MHFSILSRRKTSILFELSYKMVLVFISDKSCYCFDRISCVYQVILGALNPQHKQIVLRCDAENLFIKRIKTGFAQIHKFGIFFTVQSYEKFLCISFRARMKSFLCSVSTTTESDSASADLNVREVLS